jgi:hypothetical protein
MAVINARIQENFVNLPICQYIKGVVILNAVAIQPQSVQDYAVFRDLDLSRLRLIYNGLYL